MTKNIDTTKPYNWQHLSEGKNDECWTKREIVEPLLNFLQPFKDKIIWCPFDTEESEFVKVFQENNYNVIYSHIWYGQDFYTYEPKKWDLIISNPPFTNKKQIFERALSFNKPFALLMTVAWLQDAAPIDLFMEKPLQLMLFNKRVTFKNKDAKFKINFSSAYYCYKFLLEQIVMFDLKNQKNKNQLSLFDTNTEVFNG